MRRSILLKLFIVLVGVSAIGGAVVLGLTRSKDVRGDSVEVQGSSEVGVQEPIIRVEGAHLPMPEQVQEVVARVAAHETEAAATVIEEEPAVAYLRRLSERDLATYVHPSGAFSFRYPRDFELLTTSPDDEVQGVDALHPTLPLEISLRAYPRGKYVPDIPEAFTTYQWPAPGGDDNEATVFLEESSKPFGSGARYRGTMWFEAETALFEIKLYAPEVPRLVEWMDQFLSEDFTIPTSASSS